MTLPLTNLVNSYVLSKPEFNTYKMGEMVIPSSEYDGENEIYILCLEHVSIK